MFAEAVRQSPPFFAYVDFLAELAGYAIADICGDACKMVSDFSGLIGPDRSKGTSFASCAFTCEARFLVGCQT